MLLMRAWLSAVDRRGMLDFRSALDFGRSLPDDGSDSWLALAMSSKALSGRFGTSKRVASAAGKAERILLID
jgi:hypothetical protein